MWHWGYDAWWMGLSMILFWVGVIAVAIWAIRAADRRSSRDPSVRRALDVLEERYARGEIDDEEFERRKATLERT